MIPSPASGKVAMQYGALFGVSLGVLLIVQDWLLPSPVFVLGLPVLAFLFAGLFAAKRTGKVSTSVLAGVWSGIIGTLIAMAAVFIALLTVGHAGFVSGARSSGVDPRYAEQYAWAGLVFVSIILAVVMAAIGSGFGALGGLIGKRMSPMAGHPYAFYPPTSSPMQALQEFSYQSSPPPQLQHVYSLRPLWRLFYCAIYPLMSLLGGLAVALNILDTSGSSTLALFLICLLTLAVGYNIYYGIRMSMARLVTSPEGVTYEGVGFRIYTPWHQIAGMSKVWKRWMPITGLTFRIPPALVPSVNQALQGQLPVIAISLWRRPFYRRYTKIIPLTWFVGNLHNSSLGRDIGWSAPHLLGGIPSASNNRGENHIREMQEEEEPYKQHSASESVNF
jgi:hypothetical protein